MSIEEYKESLPVGAVAGEVVASLRRHNRLVVTAPPGSGKSTLLPLVLAEGFGDGKIVMLEPRRAAARQIAVRMADMLGERVGETVGYRMRFESKVSRATRVEVVTEGVMERMLIDDPMLDGVAAVVFDEFHERSLTADLALALTLEAQNSIRPDLLVVVMSATIEASGLCAALKAPLIEAQGRMYDVEIRYGEDIDPADCVPAVVSAVRRAYSVCMGNILAFLPGQWEIAKCMEALGGVWDDADIVPLHGQLPPSEQYRAIVHNPEGRRKIVLATPIAETSLTIEGVAAVVDSGLYKAVRYDPSTGLGRLVTERISLDMARQRAGRAGRLSDGVCYRLWSKGAEHRMRDNRVPEICGADLSGMILGIAAWGGCPADSLPWLTPPPAAHMAEGRRLLSMLGAIDGEGGITPRGKEMAALPCHPRLAGMLVSARECGLAPLAADIAAVVGEKDPLDNEDDADITTRIALMRESRRKRSGGRWSRMLRVAEQYGRMTGCRTDDSPADAFDAGMLLARAYPERIAMRQSDGIYRLASGESVRLGADDDLSGSEFLVVAAMGKRIFLAAPVAREFLETIAAERANISWNSREGRVVARNELRIGFLTLGWRRIENPDRDTLVAAVCGAAAKEGRSMFDFGEETAALQRRVGMVAEWHPELGLPDVSAERLLATASDWLPLYIGNAATLQELRRIDMCEVIRGIVGYPLMQETDRIAPSQIKLPCGRNVRIRYREGCPAPVVSARIQDCFGMTDTPRVDGGSRPVLMELLSPGFKPVQLTQDLRGFWTGTYYDVRKELKRRYPKHRWPDNPLDFTPDPAPKK